MPLPLCFCWGVLSLVAAYLLEPLMRPLAERGFAGLHLGGELFSMALSGVLAHRVLLLLWMGGLVVYRGLLWSPPQQQGGLAPRQMMQAFERPWFQQW